MMLIQTKLANTLHRLDMWKAMLWILIVALGGSFAAPEDIYLEEGGYKGILLAVHPSVKYDPNILPHLRVSHNPFVLLEVVL